MVARSTHPTGQSPDINELSTVALPTAVALASTRAAVSQEQARSTQEGISEELAQERAAFISRYGIRAIEDQVTQVAVKNPSNVTFSVFLEEAQELSIALHKANPSQYQAVRAIWTKTMQRWLADPAFQEKGSGIEVVTDGCFPGSRGRGMSLEGQEKLLAKKGLTMEHIRELAVAHIARYILDGQSIFNRHGAVRAVGGALGFNTGGLFAGEVFGGDTSCGNVSASARLAPLGLLDRMLSLPNARQGGPPSQSSSRRRR